MQTYLKGCGIGWVIFFVGIKGIIGIIDIVQDVGLIYLYSRRLKGKENEDIGVQ